jgi:ABC-type Fe3+/spermidine/putrescine transport system ATPase subunit
VTLSFDVSASFTASGDTFDLAADLTVENGDTFVVLGPSGSGKTLLLESVAGFHDHEGSVSLDGRDLTDVPPEHRDFGFVFQDYALFPHMTARENVAFGARYHPEVRDPDELLARLGVDHLAERRPRTLSGGERQRVALARALAIRPDALLLDEPLSALDVPTRQALRDDLADAIDDATAVYVTHNRTTARAIADEVAVMRDGRVVQTGSPADVFRNPASTFVARFVGANVVPVAALGTNGETPADATAAAVRPEHVGIGGDDVRARVERVVREDAAFRVSLAVEEATVDAFVHDPPTPGDVVGLTLPEEHVTYLAE